MKEKRMIERAMRFEHEGEQEYLAFKRLISSADERFLSELVDRQRKRSTISRILECGGRLVTEIYSQPNNLAA